MSLMEVNMVSPSIPFSLVTAQKSKKHSLKAVGKNKSFFCSSLQREAKHREGSDFPKVIGLDIKVGLEGMNSMKTVLAREGI